MNVNYIMLTLVTAVNTRFFNFLKQIIKNVTETSNKSNTEIRIVVYNLGMTDEELDEIKSFSNIILENFDFSRYPDHVDNILNFAWKPIIIHDACEKYGGLVHWMDSRNLYDNFSKLIEILEKDYIYSARSSGTVRKWTHPKCLEYMNGHKYVDLRCRNAAFVGINYNINWVREFVKEWRDLALIKECICPDGSSLSNHRQDQSILTILYYRYHEIYNFNKNRVSDHKLYLNNSLRQTHNNLLDKYQ